MSPRTRLVVGFLLANLAIALIATVVLLHRPGSPPQIQGVLLPQARALPEFRLLDHHNRAFTNADLQGHWHLLAYGFTSCPDICPTTLSKLASVARQLDAQGHTDLRVAFYSVDHRRDTAAQLAAYLPFFHPDFIGLTHLDDSDNPHLPFEQGLGIVAQLVPATGPDINPADNEYDVLHGVTLYLINPRGELQAILEPRNNQRGPQDFDPQTVLRDYLAIRHYLG